MKNEIIRVVFTGASAGIDSQIGEILEQDWSQVVEDRPRDLVEATLQQICDNDKFHHGYTRDDILYVKVFNGSASDRHAYKQDSFWDRVEFSPFSIVCSREDLDEE